MAQETTPEEVANTLIEEMVQNNRWEELRVNVASILRVSGDYKIAKQRAFEILNTAQFKARMRQPTTTEYDLAATAEKAGVNQKYRTAMLQILNPDYRKNGQSMGYELREEIYQMVEKYFEESESEPETK